MSYTMYTPLNVWLDPASIADVVAYIQKYLSENTIYSEEEIEELIHDYLIAHPELIGGVQSVNGKTGTVVLSASDINTSNNTTIQAVINSLSADIANIVQSVTTLSGRVTANETSITNEATARENADTALGNRITALQGAVGSPLVASTATAMTDTTKIYVYTGSESGYTNGNWYYYNGSAWTSGGVYNATAINTDITLTVSGMAADAKATGDGLNDLKSSLTPQELTVTDGIDKTIHGITISKVNKTTVRLSGAVTSGTAHYFFIYNGNNSYAQGNGKTPTEYTLQAGTYSIRISADSAGSMYSIGYILKGDTTTTRTYLNDGDIFTVSDEISFFVRTATSFDIPDGENVQISIYDGEHADYPVADSPIANDLYARARIAEISETAAIPEYYKDYIATKANAVNAVLGGGELTAYAPDDVDQFIFFTDYHFDPNEYKSVAGHGECNTKNSPSLMQYLIKNTGVNKIIFGGDIATSYSNSKVQQFLLDCFTDFKKTFDFAWHDLFSVNGNHEYNTQSVLSYGKLSQILRGQQDRFIGEYNSFGDYVLEIRSKKMWYIFINTQNNVWDSGNQINDNQINFLFQKLTEIPSGFSTVIVTHSLLTYTDELIDWNWNLTTAATKISNGLSAFVSRTAHTFNNITYDFTNVNADIICCLSGHTHVDTSYILECGVPVIMTTTDTARKRGASYYDSVNQAWVNSLGFIGTYREQAFDVVTIDKKAHKIYMTRIGYEGFDPENNFSLKENGDREFSYPSTIV